MKSANSRPQKLRKKNWTNQEGILSVRRSLTLRGKKSGSNQNFLTYGQWAKKCWFVGETFLAELSTPHSICPEKRFESKGFHFKRNKLDILFWLDWRNSRFVAEVFDKGVKNNVHLTRGFCWWNVLWEKIQLYIFWWFFWGNSDLQENSKFVSKTLYASSGTF